MSLFVAILLAALCGGDDKETPVKRRQMPLSSREAVSLALNHNLDIEVARYQPWIEEQNVYSALGTWDHTAYADYTQGLTTVPGTSSLSGGSRVRNNQINAIVAVRKTL